MILVAVTLPSFEEQIAPIFDVFAFGKEAYGGLQLPTRKKHSPDCLSFRESAFVVLVCEDGFCRASCGQLSSLCRAYILLTRYCLL
jgi:hypothetical protein